MAARVLRHKHVRIDQAKLDKAKQVLAARTDTETLDRCSEPVGVRGGDRRGPSGHPRQGDAQEGPTVITQNERDYRAIQAIRPFGLSIVPAS
jgi:hypothetical protein